MSGGMVSETIEINCVVLPNERTQSFPIQIPRSQKVSDLKKLIKAECANTLDHIDAHLLQLWRVSIPYEEKNFFYEVQKTVDDANNALKPSSLISEHFAEEVSPDSNQIHIIVRPPSSGDVLVRTTTPENKNKEQTLLTTPLDGIVPRKSIDGFLKELRPKIKEFLSSRRLPVWMPPGTVDADIRKFYEKLAIPCTHENKPNLLLHNLGKDSNPNVDNLFQDGTHHRILCNTSGAGKTALIFNGLCRHWGFYFVAQQDPNMIGVIDLEQSIDIMSEASGWIANAFSNPNSVRDASSANENIAFKWVYKVLLTRWIIFRAFLEVAKEANNGKLPNDVKHDWLLFQILPVVLVDGIHPFLAFLNSCLLGISSESLLAQLRRFSPIEVLGSGFNPKSDHFFYVLDEAQVAGERYMGAFADTNGEIRRPVLRPIITAWHRGRSSEHIRFIVSGTGFSSSLFKTVLSSSVGKVHRGWEVVHETGDFTNRVLQESYISRYLPATFLSSTSGIALISRMYEWLRGRHRFTASFLEQLLVGGWASDRPISPHKLLNEYVYIHSEFTPIDCDDNLLAAEADVERLKLYGFSWEKIARDAEVQEELSTSLYNYITRGEYPMWYSDRQDLVEYGVARFKGKGEEVIVEEPLALIAIMQYFEASGRTLDKEIRRRMQSNKGIAFEEAVLLSCTKIFQRGARLCDVFQFHGTVPSWAQQMARIVVRQGQEHQAADIVSGRPVFPSTGVAYYARSAENVKEWLISNQNIWCVPGNLMGPDLMARLQLEDGKLLLLLIQAKCHLVGNISTLAAEVTAKAIRSLSPNYFFKRSSAKEEITGMLGAINNGSECFTGGQYNILRVIAAYPLDAGIGPNQSREISDALDSDQHPLAIFQHSVLLASLATSDSTPSILSSLQHSLKRKLGSDSGEDECRQVHTKSRMI